MVLGQRSGLVVARDVLRECLEILADLQGGDAIDVAPVGFPAHVVDPQHVVPPGRGHRLRQLELERLVDDVVDPIALGEPLPGGSLEQLVEFRLRVGFLRREGDLQRQEDAAVVVPHVPDAFADAVQFVQRPVERLHRGGPLFRGVPGAGQHRGKAPLGRRHEHVQRARAAALAEQAVERQDHLFQDDAARQMRHRLERGLVFAVRRRGRPEEGGPRVDHPAQHILRVAEGRHGGDIGGDRLGRVALQPRAERHDHPGDGIGGGAERSQGGGQLRGRTVNH